MGEDEVTACSREAGLHPTTPQEEQGLLQKGPCLPQHIHTLEATGAGAQSSSSLFGRELTIARL